MRKIGSIGIVATALLAAATAGAQNRPASAPAPSSARSSQPAAQQSPPARPAAQQQQAQVPQAAGLLILIRSSLVALNQANQTGNYQVLHAIGSDTLRARTNPQTLAQSFAPFRQRNVNLNPVLYLNPQLSKPAVIEQGRLHLIGSFPTTPLRIDFDLWFEPSQQQWKIVQMNVNLTPATPPQPQQPQPPQKQRR